MYNCVLPDTHDPPPLLQPPLPYTAPELVAGSMASSAVRVTGAADVFSLAALTYELLSQKQLLPVGCSAGEHCARVGSLGSADMTAVPRQLEGSLRGMLAQQASMRPNAAAFASCQWFQEDVLLRALKFMDSILQVGAAGGCVCGGVGGWRECCWVWEGMLLRAQVTRALVCLQEVCSSFLAHQ